MASQIWVKPEIADLTQQSIKVDGSDLNIRISPYDIPTIVSAELDKSKSKFNIQFDYIDNEPAIRDHSIKNDVEVFQGKHSQKILKINVPVKQDVEDLEEVQNKILKAFAERGTKFDPDAPIGGQLNQIVVLHLLKNTADFKKLAADLVETPIPSR